MPEGSSGNVTIQPDRAYGPGFIIYKDFVYFEDLLEVYRAWSEGQTPVPATPIAVVDVDLDGDGDTDVRVTVDDIEEE